jgi:hypothetical protein
VKRILITGNGKSASWKIRGEQLGAAIDATITPKATHAVGFDLTVIVKRIDMRFVEHLRAAKTRLVYDIVDAWPQPHGNLWDRAACLRWLKGQLELVRPYAAVAATQAMADDIVTVGFKGPVVALPHHARPGQAINPIRRVVETVGYEGGVQYLGKWRGFLEAECARRGWRFVVNPPALADLDIVVALREADGYAPKHWKSNVKLANAQGSGTPIICNREAGYLETDRAGATWADTAPELRVALATLADATVRHHVAAELRAAPFTLESVAANYREWLESL